MIKINLIGEENEGHLYCPKCERLLYPDDEFDIKNKRQCMKCSSGVEPSETIPLRDITFIE